MLQLKKEMANEYQDLHGLCHGLQHLHYLCDRENLFTIDFSSAAHAQRVVSLFKKHVYTTQFLMKIRVFIYNFISYFLPFTFFCIESIMGVKGLGLGSLYIYKKRVR